ncbi:MAG: hypothetical protein AB7F66_10995 [Bacteriovoracia bacterium]
MKHQTKFQKPTKISSGLSGVAGEYSVAAELCRRGYLACITLRNAKGVDILATNATATTTAAIQVKSNQDYRKYWLLNKKAEDLVGSNFFYVLVNLGTESRYPEFHVVPSKVIAEFIKRDHQTWLKTPGKKGQARQDTTMRKFVDSDDKYLGRWDLLGLD